MSATDILHNHHHNTGIMASLRQFGERMRVKAQQNQAYRQVFDELSMLSDRDLADIGLSRSDITDVAKQAAAEYA
ncbi:DUF1127 domain-containing protein [Pararhodobacter oceanensis]|uniref:DUF1127 domain-containing protein n=1 Tax=Pararhodobacter oceanensis TaxID=2172121 RepID=UPI001F0C5C1F|nr:DUF1127 domain-containing protein [Pararhodobacter oceanensis]